MYPKFTVAQEKQSADIHEGDMYRCEVFSETVADNGLMRFMVQVGAQPVELFFQAEASGLAQIQITETASIELAGTNQTLFNQNRNSGKSSISSVSHAGSFSQGTQIFSDIVGHAVPGNSREGSPFRSQLILANSENYHVAVQNLSGGAASVMLALGITDVT